MLAVKAELSWARTSTDVVILSAHFVSGKTTIGVEIDDKGSTQDLEKLQHTWCSTQLTAERREFREGHFGGTQNLVEIAVAIVRRWPERAVASRRSFPGSAG